MGVELVYCPVRFFRPHGEDDESLVGFGIGMGKLRNFKKD